MPYTQAIQASKIALATASGFLFVSCGLTLWSLVRLAPHLGQSETDLAPYCTLCATLAVTFMLATYTTTLAILCAVRGQTLLGGKTRSNGMALSLLAAIDAGGAAATLALFAKAKLVDPVTGTCFGFAALAALVVLFAGQRLVRITRVDTMPTPASFSPPAFSSLAAPYATSHLTFDGAMNYRAFESRSTFEEDDEKDNRSISERRFGRSAPSSPQMVTVSLRSSLPPLTTVSQRNSPSPSPAPSPLPYVKESSHYFEYASARRPTTPRSKNLAPSASAPMPPTRPSGAASAHSNYIIPDVAPVRESWAPAAFQKWITPRSNHI